MTADEIEDALARGAWVPKPSGPNPARPVSEVVGCSDHDALVMARAKRLVDQDNILHCWNCGTACDWHVSLHCAPCRVTERRERPERQRVEREAQRAQRQREQEQSRPQQRVANRSFRDEY